jgi:hypothetical protein
MPDSQMLAPTLTYIDACHTNKMQWPMAGIDKTGAVCWPAPEKSPYPRTTTNNKANRKLKEHPRRNSYTHINPYRSTRLTSQSKPSSLPVPCRRIIRHSQPSHRHPIRTDRENPRLLVSLLGGHVSGPTLAVPRASGVCFPKILSTISQ